MVVEAEAAVEETSTTEESEAVPQDTDADFQAQVDKLEAARRASGTEEESTEAAEETGAEEEEKSYLSEDALEQIVKFKENGEERELSVKDLTALAQKAGLWDRKNQELAERSEELESREQQQPRPQAQQTQTQQPAKSTENDNAVAQALTTFRNADEKNQDIAEIAWANYQTSSQLAAKVQQLEEQITGISSSAKQKTSDERMAEDFRTILDVDKTLTDDDLIKLQNEAENSGFPSVADYYRVTNSEKVIAKRVEEALAAADTAKKNGSKASVRPASSSTRSKGQNRVSLEGKTEAERHQMAIDALRKRGIN